MSHQDKLIGSGGHLSLRSSIVIPNFNGLSYLSDCLNSLKHELDLKLDEVLLVDNASTDNSIGFVKENFPFVKIISLNENYGFSYAVNEGIKESTGEFVVLLNNDTQVCNGWLESLIKCIENDPSIFAVSSKMIRMNEKEKIDDAGDGLTLLGWAYKHGDGKHVDCYNYQKEVFSACAGAAIYRKDIFKQIGVFDTNFFAYLEDVDISYRAKVYGYKNMYCPSAKVYHVGSATSGSGKGGLNSFKVSISARNNVYMLYKNMPLLQLIINSPFLLLGFLWKFISYYRKGFGNDYYMGTVEGFKTLKKIKKLHYDPRFFGHYLNIELNLIGDTFRYYYNKLVLR